jgi:hypothetical protein
LEGADAIMESNKPNAPKTLAINDISQEWDKQTQATYQPCYQLLTAILGPVFEKFGWIGYRPITNTELGGGKGRTNPNKPNVVNTMCINDISPK